MKKQELVSLLERMTVAEKIGQLQQVTGDFFSEEETVATGPLSEHQLTSEDIERVGSVLSLSGAAEAKRVQAAYLEKSRLGIPLLFMADIVHGYQTIFPIPLGLGATWNPERVKQSAVIAAKEASLAGLHVTFSPMVDLVRDPRWGRVLEATGEDPYLNRCYAKAFVEGYQGDQKTILDAPFSLAACVKHFAAYGAPEGGREYNTVNMSDRELRENYLPSYQAAIEAGSKLVMTAFNLVDGIPATANERLNRTILRDEFQFKGTLISDWDAIQEVIAHGVAEDEKEAARLALQAGVDIEMMSFCYHRFLPTLIEEGLLSEDLLDEAVLRILELKNDLELFEKPDRFADEALEARWVYSEEHLAEAQKAAEEAVVLLKNEAAILPLQPTDKVAFIGTHVASGDLLGTWSWKGDPAITETIQSVLEKEVETAEFVAIENLETVTDAERKAALEAARAADKVVLFLGESSHMSGEASSRSHLGLPGEQTALLQAIQSVNPHVVAVIFAGRPLVLETTEKQVEGLLYAWFPGSRGARALQRILYGEVAPTGKTPMSFPVAEGQIPVYYNAFQTGRPENPQDAENKYVSKYLDIPNEPLYPFGYGLTYGKPLTIQNYTAEFTADSLNVQATLANEEEHAITETIQVYVRDHVGQVARPLKELKAFKKITVGPTSSEQVTWEIPLEELGYVHPNLERSIDPGKFSIMLGFDSQNVQEIIQELAK